MAPPGVICQFRMVKLQENLPVLVGLSATVWGEAGSKDTIKGAMKGKNISSNQGGTFFDPRPDQRKSVRMSLRKDNSIVAPFGVEDLPHRKGPRPRTMRGPLHIQRNAHGHPKYLNQLVSEVLTWPHIESIPSVTFSPKIISIRLQPLAASRDPSAFITGREFARVLTVIPTIYLALPFDCAHWAALRGCTEPHYLRSHGMISVSTAVLYTPRNQEELTVCHFLFSASYDFACKFSFRDEDALPARPLSCEQ
jgi:hypothetical protein